MYCIRHVYSPCHLTCKGMLLLWHTPPPIYQVWKRFYNQKFGLSGERFSIHCSNHSFIVWEEVVEPAAGELLVLVEATDLNTLEFLILWVGGRGYCKSGMEKLTWFSMNWTTKVPSLCCLCTVYSLRDFIGRSKSVAAGRVVGNI